jgi:hypothetical protein
MTIKEMLELGTPSLRELGNLLADLHSFCQQVHHDSEAKDTWLNYRQENSATAAQYAAQIDAMLRPAPKITSDPPAREQAVRTWLESDPPARERTVVANLCWNCRGRLDSEGWCNSCDSGGLECSQCGTGGFCYGDICDNCDSDI